MLASSASSAVGALAAGTDGYVLTADSAQTLGIKWAATGSGAPSFSWTAKTSNYTLQTSDTGILGDATSGAITLTLPTAVGATALYVIRKKDSARNQVTVATTSSQTIDGNSTWVLGAQGQSLAIASDGANWYRIAGAVAPEKIDELIVAGSVAANITFASIPGQYRHLRLHVMGRGDASANHEAILVQLNADTAANYDQAEVFGNNTTVSADNSVAGTSAYGGYISAATALASGASGSDVLFYDYARTQWDKTWSVTTHIRGGTGQSTQYIVQQFGAWRSTAAITSIKLTPNSGNFAVGTVAALFGVP